MNQERVINLVKPYLNSQKELSYDEFDKIFNVLEKKEQYEASDFLNLIGIKLVDEKTTQDNFFGKLLNDKNETNEHKIIIVKNNELKNSKKNNQNYKTTYKKRKNPLIYESNESLVTKYQHTKSNYYIKILIEKNKNFLYKEVAIAKHKYNIGDLEDDDLFQSACMGLIEACYRFDINKQCKLITYATFWVKQRLTREIMNTATSIRLPVHVWEKIFQIQKCIFKDFDIDIKKLSHLVNISENKVLKLLEMKRNCLSIDYLDRTLADENNMTLLDTISDNRSFNKKESDPEKYLNEKFLKKDVRKILNYLNPKEKDVIVMRYGLDKNGQKKTLGEIGSRYGVSRERIRQIEIRAIDKLKKICGHKILSNNLKNCINETNDQNILNENFNSNYYFRKNNAPYFPSRIEMFKRVLNVNRNENNIEKIYSDYIDCSTQNGYKVLISYDDFVKKYIKYNSNLLEK